MTKSIYIEKRNQTYYYIRYIPKKYQTLLNSKRIKYSLRTSNKKSAKKSALQLNSNFSNLLYNIDNLLINNKKNRLKTFLTGEKAMMHMIVKGANYANKTIDTLELDPNFPSEELKLFKEFNKDFINNQLPPSERTTSPENQTDDTLQNLSNLYSDERVSTNIWPEKRRKEIGAIFDLFLRVNGSEIQAKSVTRKMAAEFKQILLKLPPNINGFANVKRYGGKSLDEIIALGDDPMSTSNVNKYIGNLSSLFQWGEDNGYVSKNPFSRLKIKNNSKQKVNQDRSSFTSHDLIQIHNEIYTRKSLKPYMYWIPLMGLYSGARLREYAQLYVKDIVQIDGVWLFEINEDSSDKSVKNAYSIRLVPVHQKLISLGLLDYVAKLKEQNEERLFPELKNRREGYGTTVTTWFSKVREKIGMTGLTPMKDYHSYRHTFTDHLKQKGYPEEQVSAITGHSAGSITYNRYGSDYNSKLLVELMNDVNFNNEIKNILNFTDMNINYKP